ncbi:hypothetical protein AYO20_11430 [Fonsecaea nubica]|uniref:Uncharacterized protein n=1 Tax=Fonsecaea nubica TaxID=856822 RepID=A0A178BUR0_9EURO|nr:hypothetical protein AYO20_11430 [Fonsecaea nubica]OAL21077.1 hypothetical protein AYO20_11430 [Fonsecaea nubica]
MASLLPEGKKELVRRGYHPDQRVLDRSSRSYHHQHKEIRAIDNLQAQWAEHFDNEIAKEKPEEKAEEPEAPRPTVVRRATPTLRRVTQRIPTKNYTAIPAGYFERPALASDFDVTCILDYHAFLFDRHEFFSCKNPTCQLHMRRLQELNSRLKEDLERPRVKVAEASMRYVV